MVALLSVLGSLTAVPVPPEMDRAMFQQILKESSRHFPQHPHALSAASARRTHHSTPLNLDEIYDMVGHSSSSSSSHPVIVPPKPPRQPYSFSSSVIPLEPVSNHPLQSDLKESAEKQVVKQVQDQQSTSQHAESGVTLFGHDPAVSYQQLFEDSPTMPKVYEPSEIQPAGDQHDPEVAPTKSETYPVTESGESWMVVNRKKKTAPNDDALQTIPGKEGDDTDEEWTHVNDPED